MERSTSAKPGPVAALRPILPKPVEGSWKVQPATAVAQTLLPALLNQFTVPELVYSFAYAMGAIRFGCCTPAVPVYVDVVVMLRGLPVCHCTMLASRKPSIRRF